MGGYNIGDKSNKNIVMTDNNDYHTYGEITTEPKDQFPLVNYYVPLLISTNSIIDIFKQTSKQQKFHIIECDPCFATAVYKEPFSVKKWLFKCLPVFGGEEAEERLSVSAVRIMISVNEVKSWRKITVKGLYGHLDIIKAFIKIYNRKIKHKLNKGVPKSARKNSKKTGKLTFSNNYDEISFISDDEESKSPRNGSQINVKSSQQPSSKNFTYYYFHKILSSDQYSLGKKVSNFLSEFETEYKSIKESSELLPQPLQSTINMINVIVADLYSDYNMSRNSANPLQFWRTSVEKYIFSKVYPRIFGMYIMKYNETDATFVKRSAAIKAIDPIKMLEHLGVNKKYIISDNFQFSNSEQKFDFNDTIDSRAKDLIDLEKSQSDSSEPSTLRSPKNAILPYHESIKALERISSFTSPREKLEWVIDSFSNMKASIVDYWKGKVELQTMDDILPLTIYTVWYCNCSNFASEINFLKDFLNITSTTEADESIERTLVNIEMGIQYANTTDDLP